jgi:hypothetical protein
VGVALQLKDFFSDAVIFVDNQMKWQVIYLTKYFGQTFVSEIIQIKQQRFLGICSGRIAQLGEHSPYKAGVTGSIPVPPTIHFGERLMVNKYHFMLFCLAGFD